MPTRMWTRELFDAVSGEYRSFSQLESRLVEVYRQTYPENPSLFGMSRLLELGRDRGWIKASNDAVVVSTAATTDVA